jgi:hypothetical protein
MFVNSKKCVVDVMLMIPEPLDERLERRKEGGLSSLGLIAFN